MARYDSHYLTPNLFGEPYPILIKFFRDLPTRGHLLDIGCGQGRNALPLAKEGYDVTGIDISAVGLDQMQDIAAKEGLTIKSKRIDVHEFSGFQDFDYVLLDNMLHFGKREKNKETRLLSNVFEEIDGGAMVAICIQHVGKRAETLIEILSRFRGTEILLNERFVHAYEQSGIHGIQKTEYLLIVAQKFKI